MYQANQHINDKRICYLKQSNSSKYECTVISNHQSGPAKFEIRGATSLEFCRFPKLSFKVEKETFSASFGGVREFQVGTHCDPDPNKKDPAIRLFGTEGLKREQLVYQLAQVLGVPTSRARLAKVVYKEIASQKELITADALLIESHKDVAERLQSTQLKSHERDAVKRSDLEAKSAAETHLFNLFAANLDFIFNDISGTMNINDPVSTFRNIKIVRHNQSGFLSSYPYDFDVSLFARGFIFTNEVLDQIASSQFFPGKSVSFHLNRFGLEYFKKKHSPQIIKLVMEKFLSQKSQVNERIQNSAIEESQKTKISEFAGDFFTIFNEIIN